MSEFYAKLGQCVNDMLKNDSINYELIHQLGLESYIEALESFKFSYDVFNDVAKIIQKQDFNSYLNHAQNIELIYEKKIHLDLFTSCVHSSEFSPEIFFENLNKLRIQFEHEHLTQKIACTYHKTIRKI